jgi:hypothetical protein
VFVTQTVTFLFSYYNKAPEIYWNSCPLKALRPRFILSYRVVVFLTDVEFVVQHSTMSPVLPFDIIALIIDIVGEDKDTNLLKELALVSHSFLQICSKHLFATVELHDAVPMYNIASSKKGFLELLKSRPDVVKYIRKLTYIVSSYNLNSSLDNDDHLLPSSEHFLI